MLYFFYDQDQSTWGFDPKDRGSWKVVYAAAGFSEPTTAAPVGLRDECIYAEKFVGFREIASRPSAERIGLNLEEMSYDDYEKYDAFLLEPYCELPKHQMGGYPFAMQHDAMEVEAQLASGGLYVGDDSGYEDPKADELVRGAEEWGLLLQIDSDEDTGMMWGDCGVIYFWVKQNELMRGHFDDVWMILQCR